MFNFDKKENNDDLFEGATYRWDVDSDTDVLTVYQDFDGGDRFGGETNRLELDELDSDWLYTQTQTKTVTQDQLQTAIAGFFGHKRVFNS